MDAYIEDKEAEALFRSDLELLKRRKDPVIVPFIRCGCKKAY